MLSKKLEDVTKSVFINKDKESDFNRDACCMFIHGYQPKAKLEVYLYLPKSYRKSDDETTVEWLRILKSIGFKFEYLLHKDGALVVGMENEDYVTSWQLYALFCLVRWLYYTGSYSKLVKKTLDVKKEAPDFTWFECMQIAHGLSFRENGEDHYHSGSMSLYTGAANFMIKLVPIKKFLAQDNFKSLNGFFHKERIPIKTPPTIDMFKNQDKYITEAKIEKDKVIEEALKELKSNPKYKGKFIYTLTEPFGTVEGHSIVRDLDAKQGRHVDAAFSSNGYSNYVKEVIYPKNFNGSVYLDSGRTNKRAYNFQSGMNMLQKIEDK